jgi:hypothetical protein
MLDVAYCICGLGSTNAKHKGDGEKWENDHRLFIGGVKDGAFHFLNFLNITTIILNLL